MSEIKYKQTDKYIKFEIPEIPVSKKNNYAVWFNKKTRQSIIFKNKKWTDYENKFKYWLRYIKKDIKKKDIFPLKNLSKTVIIFYFSNKHRKDLLNLAQFIDLFVEHKIIEDDNWINTWPVILIPIYQENQKEKTEVYFYF